MSRKHFAERKRCASNREMTRSKALLAGRMWNEIVFQSKGVARTIDRHRCDTCEAFTCESGTMPEPSG